MNSVSNFHNSPQINHQIKTLSKKSKVIIIAASIFAGLFSAGVGGVVVYKILKKCFSKPQKVPSPIPLPISKENLLGQRIDANEQLSQAELNSLLRGNTPPVGWHHEKQEKGGLCGKHAINNALGLEVENEEFKQKVLELLKKQLGFELDDLTADDFGVDGEQLREILQVETKTAHIKDLTGYKNNKSQAITDYLGCAKWFIFYHNKTDPFKMPTKGNATYPIATGHFVAARKDGSGNWWIIDSRNPHMLDVPLTLLHKDFHLIVPISTH